MLRPASRAASQVQLWENIWNDEFVKSYRMFDRWATDTLPLAGEYFRTITKDLMWDNKLFTRWPNTITSFPTRRRSP
jgi:polyhydroxyalkanoate synthase